MIYSKESEELQLAIDFLSQVRRHLRVEYKDRRAFLTPFVHLLADPGKKHGMKGVSRLARTLYLLVDFMDADGGTNTLNGQMHRVRTIQALQRAVSGSMSRNQGIQIVKKRLSTADGRFCFLRK